MTAAGLGQSDAAGNGLAQAYAAIQTILLWALLTVLTIVAAAKGVAPKAVTVAALVMVPASGLAMAAAAGLLKRSHISPYLWPIVVPALVPPLVVAWCLFVLLAVRVRASLSRSGEGAGDADRPSIGAIAHLSI